MSGTLIFVVATEGTPPDCLALVASRANVHGIHRTVTNIERVLNQLQPKHSRWKKDKNTKSFCKIGLLAFLYDYGQRERLLNKHTSEG